MVLSRWAKSSGSPDAASIGSDDGIVWLSASKSSSPDCVGCSCTGLAGVLLTGPAGTLACLYKKRAKINSHMH